MTIQFEVLSDFSKFSKKRKRFGFMNRFLLKISLLRIIGSIRILHLLVIR